jgi:hypothetical protein
MYQRPTPQNGVSFDTVPPVVDAPVDAVLSDEEINKRFDVIAREEISLAYDKMTQDLEMSLSGYESREQPKVELMSPHPIAEQLLQIGNDVEEKRNEYHESLVETARFKRAIRKVLGLLFTNPATESPKPTLESIIEHESRLGAKLFPKDAEVSKVKFFYLSEMDPRSGQKVQKWYHTQESTNVAKSFTNSYEVSLYGIEKSSTFLDPRQGRMVNVSVPVDEPEAQNLLIASKSYYQEVTGKVYVKAAAPRFRFRSKSDYDLAA